MALHESHLKNKRRPFSLRHLFSTSTEISHSTINNEAAARRDWLKSRTVGHVRTMSPRVGRWDEGSAEKMREKVAAVRNLSISLLSILGSSITRDSGLCSAGCQCLRGADKELQMLSEREKPQKTPYEVSRLKVPPGLSGVLGTGCPQDVVPWTPALDFTLLITLHICGRRHRSSILFNTQSADGVSGGDIVSTSVIRRP
ncbi:hypothetical protein NQZ68_034196 [Dissostichus eleginoides]|nr:hypothetical protein NQZ68_034196 [Dissostichus eleginoides]